MRVVFAALFFIGGLAVVALAMPVIFRRGFPPELIVLGMLTAAPVLWGVAIGLFHPFGPRETAEQRFARQLRDLDEKGLLVREEYRARRAFQVEELEDEGLHFFLELEDGSVLFLSGQYLYDDAPLYEPECRQDRRFPCTEFTVVRHRKHGYVQHVDCRGEVLEPEVVAPAFSLDEYQHADFPEDGDVIRGRSYDEIKAERLERR